MSRSPALSGSLVTLFGGGGFLGRAMAQQLMRADARVRIVQRHPARAYTIKALGNLGQVQFVAADAADADAARRTAVGSDAVVNLVGILKGDFERAHVTTAASVAAAARAAGAAMVQISAIGADAASPSGYGRSKAGGEAAVRAAVPDAIILRPSIVFGRDDQFINRFAGLLAMAPLMPVVAPATRFQPVFVGDVADALVAALADRNTHAGRTFELGGPQILSMRQLLEWIAARIGRDPVLIDMPDAVAGAMAKATGWLPGAPITSDQWAMLQADNVVADGAATLADLGLAATPLDAVAEGWLDIYRRHGRFTGKAAAA
jgi:NADH dehydrogenase